MVFQVFDAVVVAAAEGAFQDEEAGGHVVVAVGDHGAAFGHGEDLAAEDEVGGESRDVGEVDGEAPGAMGWVIHAGGHAVEVEGFQEGG